MAARKALAVSMSGLLGVLALAACTVPGSKYSYLDVRVAGFPKAENEWPSSSQTVELSQRVHSPYNKSLTVAYEVRDDTDSDPLTYAVVATGSVALEAFGDATIDVDLGVQPPGIHTYSFVLDPADTINERYEGNNIAALVVPVADLDIVFADPQPVIATPVPSVGDITLNFTIGNTTNPGAAALSSDVTYVVTIDGDTTVSPITTASVASPVTVAGGATQAVTLTLPNPGTGHTLTITLTSSVQERDLGNSVDTVTVPGPG